MTSADPAVAAADEVISDFIAKGAHRFARPVDPAACAALLAELKADRDYGAGLFLDEAGFDADPQYRGVNPRPGRNLLDRFAGRLAFVEQALPIVAGLTALLGDGYRILDRKVVCGVPASAIPDWLKARIAGNPVNNLGAYVKPQYRDVTYFYGIDFHQDLIDFKGREADFLTLYVYLSPVGPADAPLFLLEGSHRLGAAVFPHDLTRQGDDWRYRSDGREALCRQSLLLAAPGRSPCGTPAPCTAPSRTRPTTSGSPCAIYSSAVPPRRRGWTGSTPRSTGRWPWPTPASISTPAAPRGSRPTASTRPPERAHRDST